MRIGGGPPRAAPRFASAGMPHVRAWRCLPVRRGRLLCAALAGDSRGRRWGAVRSSMQKTASLALRWNRRSPSLSDYCGAWTPVKLRGCAALARGEHRPPERRSRTERSIGAHLRGARVVGHHHRAHDARAFWSIHQQPQLSTGSSSSAYSKRHVFLGTGRDFVQRRAAEPGARPRSANAKPLHGPHNDEGVAEYLLRYDTRYWLAREPLPARLEEPSPPPGAAAAASLPTRRRPYTLRRFSGSRAQQTRASEQLGPLGPLHWRARLRAELAEALSGPARAVDQKVARLVESARLQEARAAPCRLVGAALGGRLQEMRPGTRTSARRRWSV